MTTDTIADMLTRIRNANLAKHQIVQIPSTKITRNIAQVLFAEGLIDSFEELKNGLKTSLLLSLKYSGKERKPSIVKIQRISKPGLRVYSKAKKMPRILGGFGTSIVSTADGKVVYAGRKPGFGNFIKIQHGFGVETIYAHAKKLFVRTGKIVRRGDLIASVGSTGYSTGPHVHYEVRVNETPVDPLYFILN